MDKKREAAILFKANRSKKSMASDRVVSDSGSSSEKFKVRITYTELLKAVSPTIEQKVNRSLNNKESVLNNTNFMKNQNQLIYKAGMHM